MRVESSKTNQTNKPDQTNNKSESVFRSTLINSQISAPTPAPTTGAFEKIMNEARQQSTKDEKTASKNETRVQDAESSDIKKEEEKDVKAQKELKEREQHKGDGDTSGGDDEQENQSMFASLGIFGNGKVASETSVPAARSILHIADLERIVSTLRTIESNNSKQVLIALKNSILEGLQIKLTIDANGKLKAEFLAANEKLKEQLKARKNELSEIFKNRGVKFQQLEIKTLDESEVDEKLFDKTDARIGKI